MTILGTLIRDAAEKAYSKGHRLTGGQAYPGGWRAFCRSCGNHIRLETKYGTIFGKAVSESCTDHRAK